MYARGYGLGYTYEFIEGAGGSYEKGKGTGLAFKNNARADLLTGLLVDDAAVSSSYANGPGYTTVQLPAEYLDTLENGEHKMTAVYMHGDKEIRVETTFTVTGGTDPTESSGTTESTDPSQSTETTESETTVTTPSSGGGSSKGSGTDPAHTGDSSNVVLWVVLAAAAAGILATAAVIKRKKD